MNPSPHKRARLQQNPSPSAWRSPEAPILQPGEVEAETRSRDGSRSVRAFQFPGAVLLRYFCLHEKNINIRGPKPRGRNRTREGLMIRIPQHRFNRASTVQPGSTRHHRDVFGEYFQSLPKCHLILAPSSGFLVEYSRTTKYRTSSRRTSSWRPVGLRWTNHPSATPNNCSISFLTVQQDHQYQKL